MDYLQGYPQILWVTRNNPLFVLVGCAQRPAAKLQESGWRL